jgi:hypothetical protein
MKPSKDKWIHVRVDAQTHKELVKQSKPSTVSDIARQLFELFIKTKVKK